MKQARITESPPTTKSSHGFWYTIESLDGKALQNVIDWDRGY